MSCQMVVLIAARYAWAPMMDCSVDGGESVHENEKSSTSHDAGSVKNMTESAIVGGESSSSRLTRPYTCFRNSSLVSVVSQQQSHYWMRLWLRRLLLMMVIKMNGTF